MALTFEQEIPEPPARTLPVLQLEAPPSQQEIAERLAELPRQLDRLGMRGEGKRADPADDWNSYLEGPHELAIHAASGAYLYQNQERYQMITDRAFEIPDDEAEHIARSFLESSGLVPPEEVRLLGVTHLESGGGDPEGNRMKVVVVDAGVVHGRQVKEIPVEGPGGQSIVNVDPEGLVVGFRIVWRPVQDSVGDVEILPVEHAYAAMERIAERVRGDVRVIKSRFGYFEQGVLDRQRYLQPAYSMIYTVTDGEVAYKSAEVVGASEKEFEPLIGKKRFPPAGEGPRKPDDPPRTGEKGEQGDD